ncbi:hypothetical protein K445DRAFT_86013 [Daldinia sp. EC12]|nr:hypothetical protein K445DRAFT_86013 [Daldinia sp. EC12]
MKGARCAFLRKYRLSIKVQAYGMISAALWHVSTASRTSQIVACDTSTSILSFLLACGWLALDVIPKGGRTCLVYMKRSQRCNFLCFLGPILLDTVLRELSTRSSGPHDPPATTTTIIILITWMVPCGSGSNSSCL